MTVGWPTPCRVRITPNVVCGDTAIASEIGHHWQCPYWDHVDRTPF